MLVDAESLSTLAYTSDKQLARAYLDFPALCDEGFHDGRPEFASAISTMSA